MPVMCASESVSLDILTYADLQALKRKKAGLPEGSSAPSPAASTNSKRYLILTYAVEFDRCPLAPCADPTAAQVW